MNILANITQLTYSNMALCNNTKSQLACSEKISPFLLLDMAAGADQVVCLRVCAPLQVSLSPLRYSVKVCWPRLSAQHYAVSETQAFSTLLLSLICDGSAHLTLPPWGTFCQYLSGLGQRYEWCVCTCECASGCGPGYQRVAL